MAGRRQPRAPRRAKPRVRRRRPARAWPWRLGLGLVTLVLLLGGGWIAWLDRQVVRQFEGRRWDAPAQVYARPLELFAGLRLAPDGLERYLASLGYRRVPAPDAPGSFARSGSWLRLRTRPFTFEDGNEPSQSASVYFDAGRVSALIADDGGALPLLRLDPPFLGNIFTVHGEDRVVVTPEQVPPILLAALKTVEDRDFEAHPGVSLKAIARAALANLRAGGIEQGGSTLTQQLVRSYFLDNRRTLTRKLREALMALLLELHFDKPDLLNAYVNEIYLGQDGDRAVHGFGLASQFYFGKPLAELDTHEIALLIAIVRGPSYYDPRRHPERVRARRDLVLKLMAEQGVITAEVERQATAQPLGVRAGSGGAGGYYPGFMDLVRRQLRTEYREQDLLNAGLRILTTLDPGIQTAAEQALAEGLDRIEKDRDLPARQLEGAVVVTGTQSPDVLALVGGRRSRYQGFNRALDAKRPIGSLVKPVVYLAALESGNYHLASLIDDAPLTIPLTQGRTWSPGNYDGQFRGPVPAVRALAESLNVPTVRLGMAVGPDRVAGLLRALGAERTPAPLPSLLLGAISLAPLEITQIYHSFANDGFRAPLRAVRAVLDESGVPLQRYGLEIHRAADPVAVYQLDRALVEVVQRGTARFARTQLPPQLTIAGKTGTSDDLRDSWFAGFSAEHLAVVWVGADDNRPTGLTGTSGALRIWARLFAGLGDSGFAAAPPAGLTLQPVEFATGLAADPRCADTVALPVPEGVRLPAKPGCPPPGNDPRPLDWLRRIFR